MSFMYHIASNKELPLGSFGGKKSYKLENAKKETKAFKILSADLPKSAVPLEQIIDLSHIKEDEIEVYDTFEDAAGIYVENIHPSNENVRKHFKNKFIYQVSENIGKFFFDPELLKNDRETFLANRKCITTLFDCIRNNISENECIEIYTCWYGKEGEERNYNLDTVIKLNDFIIGDSFELKEGQYILVEK